MKVLKMKRNSVSFLLITLLFCFDLYSCGGGGGSSTTPSPSVISVSVTPSPAFVLEGNVKLFSATVSGSSNQNVTWSITEPGGGTIDTQGNYTAPNTPGIYHVVANTVADSTKSATVTVTVPQYPRFAYVANKNDGTVSIYSVNTLTGQIRANGYVFLGSGAAPDSVTIEPTSKYAYVADLSSNSVLAYSITSSGSLSAIGAAVSGGIGLASITVDPSGKYLYTADAVANTVTELGIANDGSLSLIGSLRGVSNPTAILAEPSGKYIYVANNGSGTISAFYIVSGGALSAIGSPVSAGANPSAISIDPTGKYVYIVNNVASGAVSAFSIGSGGALSAIGSPVSAGTNPVSIAVDPSGRYVYVANNVSNTVSAYKITTTGGLSPIGTPNTVLAGTNPQSVSVDSSGQYVYVAHKGSNDVWEYQINPGTGVLTYIGVMRSRLGSYSIALSKGMTKVSYQPKSVYVTNASSANVSAFAITSTGSLSSVQNSPFSADAGAQSITVDPSGKFAYEVNYGTSSSWIYSIDSNSGGLSPIINSPITAGIANPEAITVDPSGRYAFIVNAGTPSISSYTINSSSGALTQIFGSPFLTPAGSVRPYSISIDPTGRFAYVVDYGIISKNVFSYSIDSNSGSLRPLLPVQSAKSFPYAVTVDPTGRFVYVLNYSLKSISAFSIDPVNGSLTEFSGFGYPFATGNQPIGIAIDPTGKFAYVANNLDETISAYLIDQQTGFLTEFSGAGYPFLVGTGTSFPQSITIDSSGKYLYVANSNSNDIALFSINLNSGWLTGIGTSIGLGGSAPSSIITSGTIQ